MSVLQLLGLFLFMFFSIVKLENDLLSRDNSGDETRHYRSFMWALSFVIFIMGSYGVDSVF